MKNRIIITCCLLASMLLSFPLFADVVPTEGLWDGKGKRTLLPAPPEASINGSTLSIYFRAAMSNLAVYVMDENGEVVYQTVISSSVSNYTYDLDWDGTPGNYQLLLEHNAYGYVGGSFTIE